MFLKSFGDSEKYHCFITFHICSIATTVFSTAACYSQMRVHNNADAYSPELATIAYVDLYWGLTRGELNCSIVSDSCILTSSGMSGETWLAVSAASIPPGVKFKRRPCKFQFIWVYLIVIYFWRSKWNVIFPTFIFMAKPNGFFNTVGELCSFCRRFKNRMMKKTSRSSNIMAVRTPISTSKYSWLSPGAVTIQNL